MEKDMLESVNDRGKLLLLPFNTLHLTEPYSALDRTILSSFYNHPQPLWIWADGTSISPGKVDPTRGRRIRNIC